ncbi:proton-associated sugar transporter A [Anoplophora glabripennis]|uniref:proton-associated sugar transporter A n=1 Tax=Anoplophora glabripennis TaxID=217634 RepID=UPI0008741FD4|nr:proton-associated sugar transporter A [Anoplophora glabripennis]
MAEKLHEYQGNIGRLHEFRNVIREKYSHWKENKPQTILDFIRKQVVNVKCEQDENEDFSHIYRRKTRGELIRISAAVMGIEFSYAAETAFVSPTLLKIGIRHKQMTLIWALSPLIGFFLTPLLGSLSDRCQLKIGRRRPFICILSLGVLMGLILVPNGESLGYALGDKKLSNTSTTSMTRYDAEQIEYNVNHYINNNISINANETSYNYHPWGIAITIIGTVLLDFDADACQSPARAYLLEVTAPDDHARGLSTFSIMAGLGGFFGYALGGINWDATVLGNLLGGHVRAVFTVITVLFVICVIYTVTSFAEVPLLKLNSDTNYNTENSTTHDLDYGTINRNGNVLSTNTKYSSLDEETEDFNNMPPLETNTLSDLDTSMFLYLKSIVYMPHSIRILCITNLFCWMAHVCYSLYFTDFVAEAVFNGSPMAAPDSPSRKLYESGVRFGCWGMSMYSLSCACYSTKIEKCINTFGCKKVYVGGLLTYTVGMCLMAITKSQFGVIFFSGTAGVMYSTLFTMPYLIIAHYHTTGTFDVSKDGIPITSNQIRGLGTDVAIISSMVFLAQFLLSICMGSIVSAVGTTTVVVSVASILSLLGAISASQILYLDL